jgi:integrase
MADLYYDERRKCWRFQPQAKGQRYNFQFKDKIEGQIFVLQFRKGLIDLKPKAKTSKRLTFDEYAKVWIRDYCRVEKAESQWKEDASVIKHHLSPALGNLNIADLKKSHLIELKARLREKTHGTKKKPLSAKSINNIVALAKKMMGTAVDMDLLPANPFLNVKLLKLPKQRFQFWTPEERDSFLEACYDIDPDFADVVLVACHTGLRLGEISGLKRRDLDFERRKIHVSASYSRKLAKRIESTKNKEVADVPMNKAVYDALFSRLHNAPETQVFRLELLTHALNKLKRYCDITDHRPIRFHDLRHTFASCLAMAGVDLMVIQKLMRHKNYNMTLRYAHLHPEHLRGSTDALICTQSARTLEAVQ